MSKVALITGASRGLGYTLASFLATQGYSLLITARKQHDLVTAAQALRQKGATVLSQAGDIVDEDHQANLVEMLESLGGLDLLVHNASVLGPSPQPALKTYPLESLRRVYEVNVFAPLSLSQKVLPFLKKRQGRIIMVTSDAALAAYEGWGGYGSSKAALELLARTLAKELQPDGISVLSVDPGDMQTQMHQQAFPDEDISDRPLPDITLPFWAWVLGQEPKTLNGQRFQAQSDLWLLEKSI